MITPTYFKRYCNKLFNDACEFKSAMANEMEFHIKCFFNHRLVAKLYVDEHMKSIVDVYTPDQCSTSTRFKWRFRHLLKKYTYVDRHKSDVIKEITKMVNSQFYAHSDDIWTLIDQVTDDVFAIDVGNIAARLMDKADMLRFGEIKWRTCTKERSKEG
ncbi:MAG: hypothetical protein IKN15_01360 [Bacteroidaceae bacterium]|nr:hypothetical protein [Bacteroidaceae bacterium]